MFALKFNGHFELKYPSEFLQDLQELLKKHNVEFFGKMQTENLGEYVDFQDCTVVDATNVEVTVSEETNIQKDE